jgi:hypothetical protein
MYQYQYHCVRCSIAFIGLISSWFLRMCSPAGPDNQEPVPKRKGQPQQLRRRQPLHIHPVPVPEQQGVRVRAQLLHRHHADLSGLHHDGQELQSGVCGAHHPPGGTRLLRLSVVSGSNGLPRSPPHQTHGGHQMVQFLQFLLMRDGRKPAPAARIAFRAGAWLHATLCPCMTDVLSAV